MSRVLHSVEVTRLKYGGIYDNKSFNKIPGERNNYYIINTVARKDTMGHWVSFAYFNDILYFIDSFGRECDFYGGRISAFFNEYNGKKKLVVTNQIQSKYSYVCGAYIIYFLYYMCLNERPVKIFKRFSKINFIKNDKKVANFLYKLTNSTVTCDEYLCPKLTFFNKCDRDCFC